MTPREFFLMAPAAVASTISPAPVSVPVRQVMDGKAKLWPEQIRHFQASLWPEAVREFGRCGVRLESSLRKGEIWRPPGREPVISGLETGVINFVITDQVPMVWDSGRAVSGATMRYRGHHVCMVALRHAHGNQIPFLSLNTCVHELLHALMGDIFENRPPGVCGQAREFRVDCYATRLWLWHDGGAIREAAKNYVERLRTEPVT